VFFYSVTAKRFTGRVIITLSDFVQQRTWLQTQNFMSYFIWWECLSWVQLYACGMSYTANNSLIYELIPTSHSHICKHHYHIPHSYNYIPMYEFTYQYSSVGSILFIAFLCTYSKNLLCMNSHHTCYASITVSVVNMLCHDYLAAKSSDCSLTYASRSLQIRSSYLYCLNWWT